MMDDSVDRGPEPKSEYVETEPEPDHTNGQRTPYIPVFVVGRAGDLPFALARAVEHTRRAKMPIAQLLFDTEFSKHETQQRGAEFERLAKFHEACRHYLQGLTLSFRAEGKRPIRELPDETFEELPHTLAWVFTFCRRTGASTGKPLWRPIHATHP
jgi:hypothetical protein